MWSGYRSLPGDWSLLGIRNSFERFVLGYVPFLDEEIGEHAVLKQHFKDRTVSHYPSILFKHEGHGDLLGYYQSIVHFGNQRSAYTALVLLIRVLSCLRELHKYGIVHKDIKPENFLITSFDSNGIPMLRLIDFGHARSVVEEKFEKYFGCLHEPWERMR